jgi:hypothetical protein
VIVLDGMMPGSEAFETWSQIPVLMITALERPSPVGFLNELFTVRRYPLGPGAAPHPKAAAPPVLIE